MRTRKRVLLILLISIGIQLTCGQNLLSRLFSKLRGDHGEPSFSRVKRFDEDNPRAYKDYYSRGGGGGGPYRAHPGFGEQMAGGHYYQQQHYGHYGGMSKYADPFSILGGLSFATLIAALLAAAANRNGTAGRSGRELEGTLDLTNLHENIQNLHLEDLAKELQGMRELSGNLGNLDLGALLRSVNLPPMLRNLLGSAKDTPEDLASLFEETPGLRRKKKGRERNKKIF